MSTREEDDKIPFFVTVCQSLVYVTYNEVTLQLQPAIFSLQLTVYLAMSAFS